MDLNYLSRRFKGDSKFFRPAVVKSVVLGAEYLFRMGDRLVDLLVLPVAS